MVLLSGIFLYKITRTHTTCLTKRKKATCSKREYCSYFNYGRCEANRKSHIASQRVSKETFVLYSNTLQLFQWQRYAHQVVRQLVAAIDSRPDFKIGPT